MEKHLHYHYILSLSFFLLLGGCSISDPRSSHSRPEVKPQTRVIPNKPERPARVLPRPSQPIKKVPYKKPIKKTRSPYKPQIRKYSSSKPSASILTDAELEAINQDIIKAEQKKREVDLDPYASIPDSSSSSAVSVLPQSTHTKPRASSTKSSSAVESLKVKARAEMLIGNHENAQSNIERGLRIEPENPNLWYLLATAHYSQSNYSQSINMARKAIQYSRDDSLTAKNWALIKKAGEKSGDTGAIKDALDYDKVSP